MTLTNIEPTPNLVQVTNISKETTQDTLRDFFAFCGKIKDFELETDGDQQKALILFESTKAAKTAELLSNALVENNHIQVQGYFQNTGTSEQANTEKPPPSANASETVSNIMAEILSSGYILGDQVLAKGIDFDHRYGVREKVNRYFEQIRKNLQVWNEQYKVTEKASEMEQRMGLQQKQKVATDRAQDWLQNNPTGQKVSGLVTQFSQHITDLHNEARRLMVSNLPCICIVSNCLSFFINSPCDKMILKLKIMVLYN
ncbi:hypothetical protein BC941DRAFT_352471 [Chlamydoabsidia padenii]|nr:hypothetical protein BC941DRAFT_352471 [Chlamydoabsidia padenii]